MMLDITDPHNIRISAIIAAMLALLLSFSGCGSALAKDHEDHGESENTKSDEMMGLESDGDANSVTDPESGVSAQERLNGYADHEDVTETETETESAPIYAAPVSLFIFDGIGEIYPDDFITDVHGCGEVTAEFSEDYDFSYPHDLTVVIKLTDEAGNTCTVEAFAECTVSDVTPPELTVGDDIYVNVGESVSYKSDVSVTDNSGEDISIEIDNSEVDLSNVGAYTVRYSARDSAGNVSEANRIVYVTEELPPSDEEVLAIAEQIYNEKILTSKYVKDVNSKYDIAYGIYKWCYNNITFDLAGTDRSKGPLKLAYEGFTTLKGDCYTYMITAKYLFRVAGIDTVEVTRLRYEGESNHFWLLVDVGDGYYHFDATTRSTGRGTDTFMLTDAEIAKFCEKFNVPHYFRFDKDAYPARSTVSYFENAIPD